MHNAKLVAIGFLYLLATLALRIQRKTKEERWLIIDLEESFMYYFSGRFKIFSGEKERFVLFQCRVKCVWFSTALNKKEINTKCTNVRPRGAFCPVVTLAWAWLDVHISTSASQLRCSTYCMLHFRGFNSALLPLLNCISEITPHTKLKPFNLNLFIRKEMWQPAPSSIYLLAQDTQCHDF